MVDLHATSDYSLVRIALLFLLVSLPLASFFFESIVSDDAGIDQVTIENDKRNPQNIMGSGSIA